SARGTVQSCNYRGRRLAVTVPMVEQIRGKADGRIGEPVQSLGPTRHHLINGQMLVREDEPLVGAFFLGGETGRRRVASEGRPVDVGWNRARHVGVDAEQSRWNLYTHVVDDKRTPVTALGHIASVAETLHQLGPGSGHVLRTPADARRLS